MTCLEKPRAEFSKFGPAVIGPKGNRVNLGDVPVKRKGVIVQGVQEPHHLPTPGMAPS